MPSEDSSLARVLKALLSTGDVTMREVSVYGLSIKQRGYRLTVDSSVILDGEHARVVRDACGIAIDDGVPSDSPMRCGCRQTISEYLMDDCPIHGGA